MGILGDTLTLIICEEASEPATSPQHQQP